jgi:hypothetical protein
MRQSTALLVIFSALTAAHAARAFQDSCKDEGKRVVDELLERWTWESFWDGSTSGFRYQPRVKATAEVFWNTDLAGMCSMELGSCTSYGRAGAGLGQFALSERVRRADLRQATEVFLRRLAEPRVVAQSGSARSQGQIDSAGHFERAGTVLSIPTPASEAVVQRNVSRLQTCILVNRRFPPLGLPKAIRDRIIPNNLKEFQQWLQSRLHPAVGAKSEYVIPYYGSNDSTIYVLVRVNGVTESVIFAVSDPSGTGWRLGGHFDPRESPTQVQRLAPLILSAKMTSVLP